MNTETESGRQSAILHLEVSHLPSHDAVLNLAADFSGWEKLLDKLQAGTEDWPEATLRPGETNLRVDDESDPQFLAKIRTRPSAVRVRNFRLAQKNPDNKDIPPPSRIAQFNSFQSLLNEIQISPRIKEVLETSQAQAVVRSRGFSGVDFVEPLAGLVNRGTGKKIMVYRYVQGIALTTFQDQHPHMIHGIANKMTRSLWNVFDIHGISVHDVGVSQLIVNGQGRERRLLLVDAEAYVDRIRVGL